MSGGGSAYSAGGHVPIWGADALRIFEHHIRSAEFPCFFAPHSIVTPAFVDATLADYDPAAVYGSLREYLKTVAVISDERERANLVLAVFFKPEESERSVSFYEAEMWRLLNYLHEHDEEPWPSSIPTDPDSPMWSFCFGGVPLFVNANTPGNKLRRSRNLGSSLILVIQPREGIDLVAPPDARGNRIRALIRNNVSTYDAIPPSPDLTVFGSDPNRDWRLYALPDDNRDDLVRLCPFRLRTGTRSVSLL